jgi:nucleoside-diphosphate-sugar epimerase
MDFKNKKIIVTGGAGVIGRSLIEKLTEKGAIVKCIDIAPRPDNFSELVEYSQRDLSQLNPIEFTGFDPDIVFHLAATFERTEEDADFWEFNFTNNVVLSHKVIDALKFCKNLKKFVFASSYLIYDPKTYLSENPVDPVKISELSKIDTRNICGAAKYYTEKELEFMDNFEKYPFSKVSARIFRVYGRGSRDFVSRSVRSAINKEPIKLFLKENSFDYIFADDVAEGLIRLAEADVKKEIVNLGTGKARKIEEVISILKNHFPDLKIEEEKKQDVFEESSADNKKLKDITGWLPEISLEEGIKELIKYETER